MLMPYYDGLTPEDVPSVTRLLAAGWQQKDVAVLFGTSTSTLSGYVKRHQIPHVRHHRLYDHELIHQYRLDGLDHNEVGRLVGCHPDYVCEVWSQGVKEGRYPSRHSKIDQEKIHAARVLGLTSSEAAKYLGCCQAHVLKVWSLGVKEGRYPAKPKGNFQRKYTN